MHHGGHGHYGYHGFYGGHVGVFVGPAFGFNYWPSRYYYYPYPPVAAAPSPPVYIERSNSEAAAQPYYWYRCANPDGYYPYVSQCSGGWQKVVPRPGP